jgi:hypothetical protein
MTEIFVFGSNQAGRHGKGAAKFALDNHGAIYGQGFGLQGNSFAIPTKDRYINTLPLSEIKKYIDQFLDEVVRYYSHYTFNITRIGCGLAGYNWENDIRPLFPETLPSNCRFIEEK